MKEKSCVVIAIVLLVFSGVIDASVVMAQALKYAPTPQELPEEFLRLGGGMERAVVDYIAGMTDQFALRITAEVRR